MSQIKTIIPSYNLVSRGRVLELPKPITMGILNLDPDSFYDGGKYNVSEATALKRVEEILTQGGEIIDIGAVSTRPGAKIVGSKQEMQRVLPFLKSIRKEFSDAWISIDTYNSTTADACLDLGADIINDVSAGNIDPKLIDVVAKAKCPYVLMHMKSIPENMQKDPYYDDVVQSVLRFLEAKLEVLKQKGVQDIILDPGFGFGKSVEDNFRLLKYLRLFNEVLGGPLMVGLSRKSMINKVLGTKPQNGLTGTIGLNMLALHNGAHILRVHDVREAVETIKLFQTYQQSGNS